MPTPPPPDEAAATAPPPANAAAAAASEAAAGAATSKKQHWTPLEANPDVFTAFARRLGLPEASAHFCDVYGLDEVRVCDEERGSKHGRARASLFFSTFRASPIIFHGGRRGS